MYKQMVSLGWYCGTASSMNRYGYRSCSSPFDWIYSDLSGVLQLMDIDFADFLSKENLKIVDGKPMV